MHNDICVIRFWAPWCAPCRMVAPTFEKVAEQLNDTVFFGEVNIDNHVKLAARYGIRGIPTTIVLKNGEKIDSLIGMAPQSDFIALVERAMK